MTYATYGNKLIGVDDAIANNNKYDFSDNSHQGSVQQGSPATWEYQYDGNGNMISDQNKGIDSIKYNFLNLPTKICFPNGDSIVYVYTVSGAKLRKTVYDNGTVVKTLDYVNGFDYKDGKLDFFYVETGRVKVTSTSALRYEYNLTDHLGNSRVFFADTNSDGTAEILQESHYYAFGMRIEGLGAQNDNKYLYNGKELTDDHGLNLYEYGWRMYDPQLGRWHQVDPMDEFMSPYCYVGNDPVSLVDPDGLQIGDDMTPEEIATLPNYEFLEIDVFGRRPDPIEAGLFRMTHARELGLPYFEPSIGGMARAGQSIPKLVSAVEQLMVKVYLYTAKPSRAVSTYSSFVKGSAKLQFSIRSNAKYFRVANTEGAAKYGEFASVEKPLSQVQAIRMNALHPGVTSNRARELFEVRPKIGFYVEGIVAPQGSFPGGFTQIYKAGLFGNSPWSIVNRIGY